MTIQKTEQTNKQTTRSVTRFSLPLLQRGLFPEPPQFHWQKFTPCVQAGGRLAGRVWRERESISDLGQIHRGSSRDA